MKNIDKQESKQLINIFATMIEATEHLQKLIREMQLDHAVNIFTSIVEGLTDLEPVFKQLNDQQLTNEKRKLDNAVLLIAKELENQKDLKILEITQFNFLPTLNRMLTILKKEVNENK